MKKSSFQKISTTYSGKVQKKTLLKQDFNGLSKKEKSIKSLKKIFMNKKCRKDLKLKKKRKNKNRRNLKKNLNNDSAKGCISSAIIHVY